METNPKNTTFTVQWSLYLVAGAAGAVIIARAFWPRFAFDNTSLVLFAIAAGASVIPYLLRALPPLKSLEAGPVKALFDRDIAQLERNVVATETERTKQRPERAGSSDAVSWEKHFDEYFRIVNAPTSNPEKILAAGILVERMVENVAKAFALPALGGHLEPREIVDRLAQTEIIGGEEKKAFDEFWSLRDRVVHGGIGIPSDGQTARILDLVWRLVRTLA